MLGPLEERRREPTLTGAPRLVSTDRLRLDPPERLAPVADRQRMRWLGPIGSLVLHLLPLLLLIEWPMAAPPEVEPIPIQLVLEPPPPPPPPPSPVPPKPQFKPPPPGRIASEDVGDTEAKEASREPSEAPAAKEVAPPPPEKTEPPPEPPQQTAAIVPPPPEKPPPPKPQQKPNPTTQQSLRRTEEPAHTEARHAKYPGPA